MVMVAGVGVCVFVLPLSSQGGLAIFFLFFANDVVNKIIKN